MLRVPRFGDHLVLTPPRRSAPDLGLVATTARQCQPWAWLRCLEDDGPTDAVALLGTDMIAGLVTVGPCRTPGDLGLDDCKSEGKRLLRISDLGAR